MKRFLTLPFLLALVSATNAQTVSDQLLNAFSASYADEAAKDYAKAINDLKPVAGENSYELNLRLGWLYYQQKDYTQAQKNYRQAMKLKPESVEALFGFAYPAVAAQNWSELFGVYQKILSIDPNNSIANYRIALMYYYRKEFAAAEKHLQKNVAHYPFDYDSLLLMAQVKLGLGKTGECKSFYQRALLYNPSNSDLKTIINKL